MKLIAAALLALALTGCYVKPLEWEPYAFQPTVSNVVENKCLYAGECDGRPYPVSGYARGQDPRMFNSDEGFGVDSPGTGGIL